MKPTAPSAILRLGDTYERGRKIGTEIFDQMEGRMCGVAHDWGIQAEVIAHAGHGDHLEIGTLFGGSAILAARIKEELGLDGKIVCVDPLNGYYGYPHDPASGVEVTKGRVLSNARLFGVEKRLQLITKKSKPWPIDLDRRFASAFIDGDHTFEGALDDWRAVESQVDKIVLIDNYDGQHLRDGVVDACTVIFRYYTQVWLPMHLSGISLALGKRSWIEEELWPTK